MDFDHFLNQLQVSADYRGQIVHVHRVAGREARFAEPQEPLSPACARMLAGMGIERLYLHQAQALDLARAGRDFLVTTSTASGKTLCYLLPIVEQLERDPTARILALYPTKALSQDQLRVFERALHHANLPQVANLREVVFARLTHIVVDELHTYTGLFGANAANLFRRLDRVCGHYGSHPQFLACSATLANPLEVAGKLMGRVGQVGPVGQTHPPSLPGRGQGEGWGLPLPQSARTGGHTQRHRLRARSAQERRAAVTRAARSPRPPSPGRTGSPMQRRSRAR